MCPENEILPADQTGTRERGPLCPPGAPCAAPLAACTDSASAKALSPHVLAFVGDGVFELLVREALAAEGGRPARDLHRLCVQRVCAPAQAALAKAIEPLLTEEEQTVVRRGRGAHTARTGAAYHAATGLEALFGFLYLTGRMPRARELFAAGAPET